MSKKCFTAVAANFADNLVVLRSNVRCLANGSGRRKWERSAKNSGAGKRQRGEENDTQRELEAN